MIEYFFAFLFLLLSIQNLVIVHGVINVGIKQTFKILGIKNKNHLLCWTLILGFPIFNLIFGTFNKWRTRTP